MKDDANEHSEWDDYFTRPRSYTSGRNRWVVAVMRPLRSIRSRRVGSYGDSSECSGLTSRIFPGIYHQLTLSIVDELRDAGVPIVMTVHDYKPVCPNYKLLTHDWLVCAVRRSSFPTTLSYTGVKDSRAASAVAALEATLSRCARPVRKDQSRHRPERVPPRHSRRRAHRTRSH